MGPTRRKKSMVYHCRPVAGINLKGLNSIVFFFFFYALEELIRIWLLESILILANGAPIEWRGTAPHLEESSVLRA